LYFKKNLCKSSNEKPAWFENLRYFFLISRVDRRTQGLPTFPVMSTLAASGTTPKTTKCRKTLATIVTIMTSSIPHSSALHRIQSKAEKPTATQVRKNNFSSTRVNPSPKVHSKLHGVRQWAEAAEPVPSLPISTPYTTTTALQPPHRIPLLSELRAIVQDLAF
jgi:hypothetical protein